MIVSWCTNGCGDCSPKNLQSRHNEPIDSDHSVGTASPPSQNRSHLVPVKVLTNAQTHRETYRAGSQPSIPTDNRMPGWFQAASDLCRRSNHSFDCVQDGLPLFQRRHCEVLLQINIVELEQEQSVHRVNLRSFDVMARKAPHPQREMRCREFRRQVWQRKNLWGANDEHRQERERMQR